MTAQPPDPPGKVVVGVDGSDMSLAALRFAIDEARLVDAPLEVVHVWMPAGMPLAPDLLVAENDAAKVIDLALERCDHTGVSLTRHLPVGSIAGALIEAAEDGGLVVVGRHGAGAHPYLGGVSQQVVHHCSIPVAVVPSVAPAGSGVVVAVDGSDPSLRALDWAVAEAEHRAVSVTAVLAWSLLDQLPVPGGPSFDPDYSAEVAREALRRRIDAHGATQTEVQVREINDLPARALLGASADAALLVCGTRGMGGFHGLLVGSVSRRLVAEARCPVVCVR